MVFQEKQLYEAIKYLDGHICKQQKAREFHEFYMTSSETHEQCCRASVDLEKTIVLADGKSQPTESKQYLFDITDPPQVSDVLI